ncbi:MAG: hypothetical protein Q8L49_04735 [Burkholderiaceae bacterium]|nr:hypothetical protein [Burkholderiaceae bacterium]
MKTPGLRFKNLIVLAAAAAFAATTAQAQVWDYKSYKRDPQTKRYSKDNFVTGTISVEEKGGESHFRMIAGGVDVCYRGAIPVTVERGAGTIVITSKQPMTGCEDFRYRIREDGSGGTKEIKEPGGEWRNSTFDHSLRPVK